MTDSFFFQIVLFISPSTPSIFVIQTMLIYFLKYSTKRVCVYLEWCVANDNMNKVRDFEILWWEWWFTFVDNSKFTIFFRRSLIEFIFFFCVGAPIKWDHLLYWSCSSEYTKKKYENRIIIIISVGGGRCSILNKFGIVNY